MTQLYVLTALMMLLTACGEDDGGGGTPDILTGLSGVVLVIATVLVVRHFMKKNKNK